jgi:hypothetical protein
MLLPAASMRAGIDRRIRMAVSQRQTALPVRTRGVTMRCVAGIAGECMGEFTYVCLSYWIVRPTSFRKCVVYINKGKREIVSAMKYAATKS